MKKYKNIPLIGTKYKIDLDISEDCLEEFERSTYPQLFDQFPQGLPIQAAMHTIQDLFRKLQGFSGTSIKDLEKLMNDQLLNKNNKIAILYAHGESDDTSWRYMDTEKNTTVRSILCWINDKDGKYDLLMIHCCNKCGYTPSSKISHLIFPVGIVGMLQDHKTLIYSPQSKKYIREIKRNQKQLDSEKLKEKLLADYFSYLNHS